MTLWEKKDFSRDKKVKSVVKVVSLKYFAVLPIEVLNDHLGGITGPEGLK